MKADLLALVTDAFGGRGGIAQYNRDLLSALKHSRMISSVTVIPRLAPDPVHAPNGIRQLPARPGRLAYALSVLRYVCSTRADIVFCGHLYMAPLAWLVARLARAKLIVQVHGVEAWDRPSFFKRAALEAADAVLSVSRFTRREVLGWANLPPERSLVLPNTVREEFTPGDGGPLRRLWALDGKYVLLTVGRMDPGQQYKGHDRVIRAMPRLIAERPDAVYVIIGDGPDRGRLQELAAQLGVAERVIFKGAVDCDVLKDAYRMADLFVMPSTGEGFGIVFLEAAACGCPVLALARAGSVDALANGELGTLAEEERFTETLIEAVRQPRRAAAAMHESVQHRFGRAQFIENVNRALERVAVPNPVSHSKLDLIGPR